MRVVVLPFCFLGCVVLISVTNWCWKQIGDDNVIRFLCILGVRQPRIHVLDEDMVTKVSLVAMGNDITSYYSECTPEEWLALQQVQDLDELWQVICKKRDKFGPIVVTNNNHYVDAWQVPYELNIRLVGDCTIIRISSNGSVRTLYQELVFFNNKNQVRTTSSWCEDAIPVR